MLKARCQREALSRHLAKLVTVSEKGLEEELYAHVTLRCNAAGSRLLASDDYALLELEAEDIHVESTGELSVLATLLHRLVKLLPASDVALEAEDGSSKIKIVSGTFETEFVALPNREIAIERHKPGSSTEVESDRLSTGINQVLFAASPSYSGRIHVEGVKVTLRPSQKRLELVSTDGRKLAFATVPARFSSPVLGDISAVVPRNSLWKLQNLLRQHGGPVSLGLAKTLIGVNAPGMEFTSKLLAAEYPNYNDLINSAWSPPAIAATREFQAAVQRVNLLPTEVKSVSARIRDSQVVVEAEKQAFGRAHDVVQVHTSTEPRDFRFDGDALVDALVHIKSDVVQICFSTDQRLCLLRSAAPDSPLYIFTCMLR